jgi:hypothetical protein
MNIETLNWLGPPWKVDEGGVKKTGRDETIGVVIHTCIETTRGNSLGNYLYLEPAKMPCSLSIFYVFSSTKSVNRRENRFWVGVGIGERREVVGKGGRRINIVLIMYTCACKCKNDTC